MENGPVEIVDFPIKKGDVLSIAKCESSPGRVLRILPFLLGYPRLAFFGVSVPVARWSTMEHPVRQQSHRRPTHHRWILAVSHFELGWTNQWRYVNIHVNVPFLGPYELWGSSLKYLGRPYMESVPPINRFPFSRVGSSPRSLRWNYLEQVFVPFFLRDVDVYGRPLPEDPEKNGGLMGFNGIYSDSMGY